MIKRIKFLITSLTMSGMIFLPLLIPQAVHAVTNTSLQACGGANLSVSNTTTACTDSSSNINGIIKWVLDIFSVIVGIAAVIMIVVGGLKYTISGGDSSRTAGAKDTILFAIVGLVVVALAQIIVHFVLHNVGIAAGGGAAGAGGG
jgi:hypothetical protein